MGPINLFWKLGIVNSPRTARVVLSATCRRVTQSKLTIKSVFKVDSAILNAALVKRTMGNDFTHSCIVWKHYMLLCNCIMIMKHHESQHLCRSYRWQCTPEMHNESIPSNMGWVCSRWGWLVGGVCPKGYKNRSSTSTWMADVLKGRSHLLCPKIGAT